MNLFNRSKKRDTSKKRSESFQPAQAVRIEAAMAQSVGKTRDHMEDAASSFIFQQGYRDQIRHVALFVVADGMGGHLNGELASSVALKQVNAQILPVLQEQNDAPAEFEEIETLLAEAFNLAQEAVLDEVTGGGSTLTAALLIENSLYFAHVGDSRLYLVGYDGKTEVLTRDHSLVQRLVDLGQISQAEAESHPQKNVLYRALGQSEGFKVDLGFRQLDAPGYIMLCSDGLWGVVNDKKITEEICSYKPLSERAQQLCDMANQAGGPDNVSVILAEIF